MNWQGLAVEVVWWVNHAVLVYFVVLNTHLLVLLLLGFHATRRAEAMVHERDLRSLLQSSLMPPVSIIVPAHNESLNIAESVSSLMQLRYPEFELVVVNDGSTDDTLDILIERFQLLPIARTFEQSIPCAPIQTIYESPRFQRLVVVDKMNGGKSDALNAGINVSRYPLFCAIDGDSLLEDDALLRVARPFHEFPGSVIAVGGTIRIANGSEVQAGRIVRLKLSRKLLPRIQVVEYLRAFLFGRMGWSALGSLLLISGAFGLFEKRAVVDAGGYATDSVGEDMELLIRMHRTLRDSGRDYQIGFVPEPVCWTEAPESLGALRRQRERWQRGLIDTFIRHFGMIGRPRYGTIGLLAMPAFLVFEMLAPLVEISGFVMVPLSYAFGLLDTAFMLAFLSAAILYSVFVSVLAIFLDDLAFRRYTGIGQLLSLVSAAVVEAVLLRPLTAFWRTCAFWKHYRGDTSWGHMERKGIATAPSR